MVGGVEAVVEGVGVRGEEQEEGIVEGKEEEVVGEYKRGVEVQVEVGWVDEKGRREEMDCPVFANNLRFAGDEPAEFFRNFPSLRDGGTRRESLNTLFIFAFKAA